MRITIPPFILYIANKAAKIPGVKRLLKPLYYSYKDRINSNRNKVFKQNALEVLESFDKVMSENNIPYSVFAGTMLGAVREKGFIKHDLDIDTLVFYDDRSRLLQESLLNAGFKLDHSFSVDQGRMGLEETYVKNGVSLDIFYAHYDDAGMTYQCDFCPAEGTTSCEHSMREYGYVKARKLRMPVSRKTIRLPFETIYVNVMDNYDDWLTCRYGGDYMIPNPDFCDNGTNQYIETDWEKAIFEKY